jgi:hypothetical protein
VVRLDDGVGPPGMEKALKRCRHPLAGLLVLACLTIGCGGSSGPDMTSGENIQAGPNRRIKIKPEYQKILNKKGEFNIKPGMYEAYKRKQAAAASKK